MSKKVIVFRVGAFPVKSETFVTSQIITAINLGYEVAILVDKINDIESSSQKELIEKYNLLGRTAELKRIKVKGKVDRILKIFNILAKGAPVKSIGTFNYFKYGKNGLIGNLFLQLNELKEFMNADIFHIQFGVYMYPLDLLKYHGLLKSRVLTTFHGFDVHYNELNKRKRELFYQYLFRAGDLFTANTGYLAGQLADLGCPEERLKVIPVPIDTGYFKPKKVKKKNKVIKILSVGRLVKWKGHEYGLRAVNELLEKGIKLEYHLVGEGEERDSLMSLVNDLGIQKNVFLHGARTQSEILDFMQSADIFLLTSTYDEGGRRETQGVVTGEAQACGLPIVAFRSGGVPYTILEGKTGLLSEENDYKGLAENLEKLILNENIGKEMGKTGRQFIDKKYSLAVVSEIWERQYKMLLEH